MNIDILAVPVPTKSSSARKCSHCKNTGHMMWDCDGVHMLWDRLYMEMEIMLEENLLGYRFEYFIESLTVPYLKIVYKMLCKKTMKKKEVYVYDEIYAAFQVLHPEYLGKPLRQTRLYGRVYSSVGTVPSNQKGSSLQSYIHSLSSYELDELVKLCSNTNNEVNWIGRQTYNREIHYLCESPHYPPRFLREIMNQKEMRIHCHFSEMGLGYHFTVLGYYNQNTPRIEAFINKNTLLMHKLVHGIPRYSKTILLEEEAASLSEEEVVTDCVVCMDSKSNKEYIKFNCSHEFCGSCVGHMMETGVRNERDILCPLCRSSVVSMIYGKKDVILEMREILVA